MRVYTLVNTLTAVSSWIYSNHIAFWTETKKEFPNDQFLFFTPPRMSIDMARNTAAREALRHECDYLLFIDDDVLLPPNCLKTLLACDADIAAGLVIIRGYPFNVMAFREDKAKGELPYFNDLPRIDVEIEPGKFKSVLKDPVTQDDGLVGVGFSLCLIKCDLLRKVNPPYFVTGPRNTEDVYFCLKARDSINFLKQQDPDTPNLKIAMSTSLQCGHFLHAEPIEWKTIDIFREFYEAIDPEGTARIRNLQGNRDLDYIAKNIKGF